MRPVTLAFLLFVAVLGVAELATRFLFVKTMEGRFDYGYHPTAGFVEKDGKVEIQRTGGRRFFPQEFQLHPPAGTYRVMVVGDSVPRGRSVERSYTGQLQKLLRDQGVQAECINLGLPGYGARRKDVVLTQALKYKPNLIILHIGITNEYEDEREWLRRDDFNNPHPKNWPMRSMVLRQLYEMKMEKIYWQWLPKGLRGQGGTADINAELRASTDTDTQKLWLQRLEEVTRQSAQRAVDAGIPILLITQAARKRSADNQIYLDDSLLDSWTAPLVSDKIARLPMKSAFTPEQVPAVYMDSNHVHAEGHRLIAAAIIRTLEEKHWLPASAAVR